MEDEIKINVADKGTRFGKRIRKLVDGNIKGYLVKQGDIHILGVFDTQQSTERQANDD